jgi:hypothetical protein
MGKMSGRYAAGQAQKGCLGRPDGCNYSDATRALAVPYYGQLSEIVIDATNPVL